MVCYTSVFGVFLGLFTEWAGLHLIAGYDIQQTIIHRPITQQRFEPVCSCRSAVFTILCIFYKFFWESFVFRSLYFRAPIILLVLPACSKPAQPPLKLQYKQRFWGMFHRTGRMWRVWSDCCGISW